MKARRSALSFDDSHEIPPDELTRIRNGTRQIRFILEEVLALAEPRKTKQRVSNVVLEGKRPDSPQNTASYGTADPD